MAVRSDQTAAAAWSAAMRMLDKHQAMDCETGPTDWAALGARIVRAASIATAIHMAERATMIANESAEQEPRAED
jgi:hypothetical protein